MTIAETSKLFERAEVKAENDRCKNGLAYLDFSWLHLPCEGQVEEIGTKGEFQKRCNLHNVVSATASPQTLEQ